MRRIVPIASIVVTLLIGLAVRAVTVSPPRPAFLGGEISEMMVHRTDISQYATGATTIENAVVLTPGVVTRRSGSTYVATTQGDGPARLAPFIYSEDDAYVLEFTDEKLRFFRNTSAISSEGSAYEIDTVFEESEIFGLQMYQSQDVMYIVHPNHPPQELIRSGHASWTIWDANITDGPFRTENASGTAISSDDVNGIVTLTATAAVWDEDHVGALWRLRHHMTAQSDVTTLDSVETGGEVVVGVTAPWTIDFESEVYTGTIKVQLSYDEGQTWHDDYTVISSGDAIDVNYTSVSDYGQNVLMRTACTAYTSGTCTATLEIEQYVHTGIVEVNGFSSSTSVTADVLDRVGIADANTTYWSEGAWSDYRGYPETVTAHAGRIVYARDLDIWWSAADSFEEFYFGTGEGAFSWTLSQAKQNPIRWMIGERSNFLLVGTLGSVFELKPIDGASSYSATNPPTVSSSSLISCQASEPAISSRTVLFPDRTGRRIHESLYNWNEQSIIAPDLTLLAPHITGSGGVIQMAFQRSQYPILWAVRSDGEMATMYYDRNYEIAAWSRQRTGYPYSDDEAHPEYERFRWADYTSVAVVPTTDGQDRVWTVVRRVLGANEQAIVDDGLPPPWASAGHYYVEYFQDIDVDVNEADAYFVDSGLSWYSDNPTQIDALTPATETILYPTDWPELADGTEMDDDDFVLLLFEDEDYAALDGEVFLVSDADSEAGTFKIKDAGGVGYISTAGTSALSTVLDNSITWVSKSFSGLDHLDDEVCTVFADGQVYEDVTPSSGSVTLDDYYNRVVIGLPYKTIVTPTPPDLVSGTNTTAWSEKRLVGLYLSVYNSATGKYGLDDTETMQDVRWPLPSASSMYDKDIEFRTLSILMPPMGGFRRDLEYHVVQDDPVPVTIRELVPMIEVQR